MGSGRYREVLEDLVHGIAAADAPLLDRLAAEGSALDHEFQEEDGFIDITYEEHWEVIRTIDVASGTRWTCR